MKLALLADLHWGIRNDSPIFLDHFRKYYDEEFFPVIDELGIHEIVILGDFFDRRKYANISTLNFVRRYFIERFIGMNCHVFIIAGNHDVYHSNTLEVNSLHELIQNDRHFTIVTDPMEMNYGDGCKILFLPWICADNKERCMQAINDSQSKYCFAHLELEGFEMNAGRFCDHGLDSAPFSKFSAVLSGHFHKKSHNKNIFYLGSVAEMTWADFNCPRGWHTFETTTGILKYYQNHNYIFHKINYNDENKELDEIMNLDFEKFKNCYIKILVEKKTNPYWLDMLVEELEKYAVDVKILENLVNKEENSNIENGEDTITILKKFINEADVTLDKKQLDNFLTNLYNEALSIGD